MPETLSISIPGLAEPKQGKVRDIYDLGDSLLFIATDRISAFDVVMENGIPDKGRILCQLSAFWFTLFGAICPNHMIAFKDYEVQAKLEEATGIAFDLDKYDLQGRSMIVAKAEPLPIECIVRGYICGSLWKEYLAEGSSVHGLNLPNGLVESQRLIEPIFTPATKAQEGHDENISEARAKELVGEHVYEQVKRKSLELYDRAALYAQSKGILLADTKFEFGIKDGQVVWIDEALTPDSSRFWPALSYQAGSSQPSYDKQFVRDYLESINWDKRPPGPRLPDDVVLKTREKYLEVFFRLTGSHLNS